ncbi:MAG: biotin--[acetyl-CoA-carboxylase] ligase [Eubacteriales bacterium]|nr:biotin--[acetyl-CoA-carboxylase] ligase [Eubacteriales bacterium]
MDISGIDIQELTQELNGRWEIHHKEKVDSTNIWARTGASEGAPEFSLYLADEQSKGKGRTGRVWQSPAGTSVSMSLVLRPDIPMEKMPMLTLVMGLAAAVGMREAANLPVEIKWPNDAVVNGKKLCGILTEMGPAGEFVICGVGLNVNMDAFPEELADKATSLYLETGEKHSLAAVTAAVLNAFEKYYHAFVKNGDLAELQKDYEAILANKGRAVRILDPTGEYNGKALGIDKEGRLLVERSDSGQIEKIFTGEVSVRGIYGYV